MERMGATFQYNLHFIVAVCCTSPTMTKSTQDDPLNHAARRTTFFNLLNASICPWADVPKASSRRTTVKEDVFSLIVLRGLFLVLNAVYIRQLSTIRVSKKKSNMGAIQSLKRCTPI